MLKWLLLPTAIFYGFIIFIRNIIFDLKIIKNTKLSKPVISIGNITSFSSSPPNNLDSKLRFCKASFFPNLRSSNNGFHTDRKSLNQIPELLKGASRDEATRLSKYSFEYFIAYSPDVNGNNSSGKKKSGTNNILYTIYSCGCNAAANNCSSQNNVIVPLEAVVTLIN